MVAYEMARQLEVEGEEVGVLALISTCTPDHLRREIPNLSRWYHMRCKLMERYELEVDNLSGLNMQERISYILDRFRRMSLLFQVARERYMERLATRARLKPFKHSRRYILEQTRLEQASAFYAFQPKPINTKTTLFRTSHQRKFLVHDPSLGWADFCKGGIVDLEIDAFHKNILKDPNVRELATRLQACLDEAQCLDAEQELRR